MSVHDEIQELIPAFALTALSAEEMAKVQAHVAQCHLCASVLSQYESVTTAMTQAVPMTEPPGDLKRRTMERALRSRAETPTRAPIQPRQRQRVLVSPFALAGLAVVVALVILLWNVWQTTELSQQLATQRDFTTMLAYAQGTPLSLHGTGAAPQADGKLYLDPDANVAALISVQMPMLSGGHVYQVWLSEASGHLVSGGTFTVDNSGNGWLLIRAPQHLDQYTGVEVTVEPNGGSGAPTTKPVLASPLPAK